MTEAQYGTPEYYQETLAEIEGELQRSLVNGGHGSGHYAFAYGRLFVAYQNMVYRFEQALENARPQCRPGCGRLSGHSGPCIERDLDAEVNAGKWGPDSYDIDSLGEFLKRRKVIAEKWNDPEFVNVNHE